MRNPIIVALDVAGADAATALLDQVGSVAGAVKIGSELFTSVGPDIVRRARATGAEVFLDLKFHDIPNTVSKAVAAATRLDVQMLTIHASGGVEMMRAAQTAALEASAAIGASPPLLLAVTVLTSMDDATLSEVGFAHPVKEQVTHLARLAVAAGIRGLVCSPLEIEALRAILPLDIQLVTPGIRGGKRKTDDQKRTMSAADALKAGASRVVIGRPIYESRNPRAALAEILGSIS